MLPTSSLRPCPGSPSDIASSIRRCGSRLRSRSPCRRRVNWRKPGCEIGTQLYAIGTALAHARGSWLPKHVRAIGALASRARQQAILTAFSGVVATLPHGRGSLPAMTRLRAALADARLATSEDRKGLIRAHLRPWPD